MLQDLRSGWLIFRIIFHSLHKMCSDMQWKVISVIIYGNIISFWSVFIWFCYFYNRDLEIMDSNTWPASGLSLARCLLHLVWTPQTESSVLLQSHKLKLWRDMWSKLARLTKFIDDLQNVKTLKNVYGVDISYSQFIQVWRK